MDAKIISDDKIKDQYSFGCEIFEKLIFRILQTQEHIINSNTQFLFSIFF